jgi:arylsulfatase
MVYPLDNRAMVQKLSDSASRGLPVAPRTFKPGGQTVHVGIILPLISNRNFRIRVRFSCQADTQGILWSIGEQIGGMVLYLENTALHFYYNGFGEPSSLPAVPLAAGDHEAVLDYEAIGKRQGRGRLLVDGQEATGWGALSPTLMVGFHEGLDIGLDRRCPVHWQLYEKHRSFRFTGTIEAVTIEPGTPSAD